MLRLLEVEIKPVGTIVVQADGSELTDRLTSFASIVGNTLLVATLPEKHA